MKAPTWDLSSPLGFDIGGAAWSERLAGLRQAVGALHARANALGELGASADAWSAIVRDNTALLEQAGQLYALASCAAAANTRSAPVRQAEALAAEAYHLLVAAGVPLETALVQASDGTVHAFLARPELADAAASLRDRRAGAKLEDPPALRPLVVQMEREALHGWGQLYDEIAGALEVDFDRGEGAQTLSIGQVAALRSHPDAAVRERAFHAGAAAWKPVAPTCAAALTHITGHRQQKLDRLGLDPLAHTLHDNRLDAQTLDAILAACTELRPTLVRYLDAKAALLGKPKLDWWDLDAPLGGGDVSRLSWAQAERTITDAFGAFAPELADFARKAISQGWVEAEDRGGKRPGAFCTDLPLNAQSRVFMTYTGSVDDAVTLAHELGHAFHNEVLFRQPFLRRSITSATAETASTFAEAIVRDRILAGATDPKLRLFMLDQQLQAGVAFLMNIPARFTFERSLYDLRRDGPLTAPQLDQAMLRAQTQAYGGALGHYHEGFWASKLHFYISSFGFYNWPYTFGYLFSGAVYARAQSEGASFLPTFYALLERTGWDDTATLAHDVLGWDLRDPAFWVSAAAPLRQTLDQFLVAAKAD